MADHGEDVTTLLQAWRRGDVEAAQRLLAIVHQELRRVAQSQLRRERDDHTLEPAALVNEVYLRLVGQRHVDWQNRGHFFALASREMRRILIDYARKRHAEKRAGFVGERISVTDAADPHSEPDADVLDLHGALSQLANELPRLADILELRYFGGLTIEEIAAVQELSPATVKRDIAEAQKWLRQRLGSPP